ncbi:OmpH family outer membrane protein [Membranicola marinus]|uniref:OmpH family outer membrane protein n=1 Tax=Membranihabitans marinus TaxID=1227546 RepID=A0A953L8V7_9BACT|nr:OmpH family outer membrane protein [Membranihabitans marinus]MBY5956968.1 OmpH family outer membrane protein [Membranihabitans marinus]
MKMKNMIKYFLLSAVVLFSAGMLQAQQKFAYVNSQELLENLPEVKAADAEIQTLQQQLQKKGQEMIESFQAKAMELQQKRDAGEMSPKQLEVESQKLQEEQDKIRQYDTKMQTDVMRKQQELLQPIQDKVNTAIETVAKADGYTMVFDSSSGVVLYADDATNITSKVKAELSGN